MDRRPVGLALPPHRRRDRLAGAQAVAARPRRFGRPLESAAVCGICGIATTRGNADLEELRAMSDLLVHRGPDSAGEYVDGGIASPPGASRSSTSSTATSRSRTRT